MRTTTLFVLALVFAACKDQGPPGPNLIVANENSGGAVQVSLVDTLGDTVFSATLAQGAIECRSLDGHGILTGNIVATDTIIAVRPFWPMESQGWSDKLLVRPGTELIQTHGVRDGCQV